MHLIKGVKKLFYFPLAYYFRFFAEIRLRQWQPKIIVITGSSGKTTLLHLVWSQLGETGRYSHGANSAYGIPFDILGLKRQTFTFDEWPLLFLKAPFAIFKPLPKEKIYVVEVDCDRPGEGKFLASLLKPAVTLWLNVGRTHGVNFDRVKNELGSVERAIAYEFGYLIQYTSSLVIVNSDSCLTVNELYRTKAEVKRVSMSGLQAYQVRRHRTELQIEGQKYQFNYLLPREVAYALLMSLALLKYLAIKPDISFSKFKIPPGRSSIFEGVKNTILIDSTYNAPDHKAVEVVLIMFDKLPAPEKWVVLGDMVEGGESEKEEHEKLGEIMAGYKFNRILLMGPRVWEYTYPILRKQETENKKQVVERFLKPREVLEYLQFNIKGGETILFKGAGFLEGIIENLLANKGEVEKLPRQEKIWKRRRKQWGL